MDEILTVPEIAKYLKVSRTTVWRWCTSGKLSAFKIGKAWRVHRSELEKIVGRELGDLDDRMSNGSIEEFNLESASGNNRLSTYVSEESR